MSRIIQNNNGESFLILYRSMSSHFYYFSDVPDYCNANAIPSENSIIKKKQRKKHACVLPGEAPPLSPTPYPFIYHF